MKFKYEEYGLSRLELRRLWRFAGTAVTLLLLLAFSVYFWAVLSSPSTAMAPSQGVVTAATRTAVPGLPPVAEAKVVNGGPVNVFFGEHIQLVGYTLEEAEGFLKVRLLWSPGAKWVETTRIWVRIQGEDGFTLKSHSVPPQGDAETTVIFEPVYGWEAPENGHCRIIISLYDEARNEALPITADSASIVLDDGRPAIRLADWECRQEMIMPVVVNLADAIERGLVQTVNITADDSLRLLSYERLMIGGEMGIALTWEVIQQPEIDYNHIFYLMGDLFIFPSGTPLVVQPVTDPLQPQVSESRPTSEWQAGEVVTQYYMLQLPPELPTDYALQDGPHQLWALLLVSQGGWGTHDARITMGVDGVEVKDGYLLDVPTDWQFGSGTVTSMPAERLAEITLYDAPALYDADMPKSSPLHLQMEPQMNLTLYGARTNIGGWHSLEVTNAQTGETIADGWVYTHDYNAILRFGVQLDPEVADEMGYGSDVKITAVQPPPGTHLAADQPTLFNIEIDPIGMGYGLRDGAAYLDVILAAPINGRLHWITSTTMIGSMFRTTANLAVTPEQLARLPQEAGELVLIMQLRLAGESRPYFVHQPEQYRWPYEQ